jgi:hypothetical protein
MGVPNKNLYRYCNNLETFPIVFYKPRKIKNP